MPTPLEEAPPGLADGRQLFLKREDVHELGAFKWRGALPSLDRYRAGGADSVVTASTGNHGAATAWAGERTGMRAVVFVPVRRRAVMMSRVVVIVVLVDVQRRQHSRRRDEALNEHECDDTTHVDSLLRDLKDLQLLRLRVARSIAVGAMIGFAACA